MSSRFDFKSILATPAIFSLDYDSTRLEYAVTHVFLPAQHEASPGWGHTVKNDHFLARAVYAAAHSYSERIDNTLKPQWTCIINMLDRLQAPAQLKDLDKHDFISQLLDMRTGGMPSNILQNLYRKVVDILMFLHRALDTAVVFRKQDHHTLCRSFETSWNSVSALPESAGSYPQWAIEIPDKFFHDQYFQSELADFLQSSDDTSSHRIPLEGTAGIRAGLLASVLRTVGRRVEAPNVTRCVRSHYRFQSWPDRSSLWLSIKVAIQTSLDHGDLGCNCYKAFMLYFMCSLSRDAIAADLSSRLLHASVVKILRRWRKLDCSVPNWLRDMVLETIAFLQKTLETRWKGVKAAQSLSSSWRPSQLDLVGDTQLSLMLSKDYIHNSLSNLLPTSLGFHLSPEHASRGTLCDILSSEEEFFDKAYRVHPFITLYDVERAVEEDIDDWLACVTDVNEACVLLEILMVKYLSSSHYRYHGNPEHLSIMLLTVIELWVALDKLVVGSIPKLADYPPEIPVGLLHRPLLRNTIDLHRLRRVYQYLSSRQSRSLPGRSVFSDEFGKEMFPIRYRVNSPDNVQFHDDIDNPDLWHHVAEYGRTAPLSTELTVFELQCPLSLHIWRSATVRIRNSFFCCLTTELGRRNKEDYIPLLDISKLKPCLLDHRMSPVTNRVYLTTRPASGLQPSDILHDITKDYRTGIVRDEYFCYRLPSESRRLRQYVTSTSHASNDVLVAQAECPDDLSSHEFIAFGHLRCGGSLQWLNILRELRGRTLNFRRHDVYLLLAQAATEVGPFDLDAAEWMWHEELHDSSFCCTILDELESLLVDVGVQSMDGVMMGSISFLVARVLASSPGEDISERAVGLLHRIRRKTFHWVQELSYNVMMAPTKTERNELLRDMAATCRSTFDVGSDKAHDVLRSVEDVDCLLSCAIFIHANSPADSRSITEYSRLLLERDLRHSLNLEDVLKDFIKADPSDLGIDLAIRRVWPGYRPGPHRWQLLPHSNSCWLTSETAATCTGRSQIVRLNLLDGTLLVDGKPLDRLPREISEQVTYKRIFGDQTFLVIASDLPGMDFSTLSMISEHRVHFALRDAHLVIRAQHRDASDILEVIPQERLHGDLPMSFVNGHVHWLNLSTSTIEIRPFKKLWEQSLQNWRIDCATFGQYRMYKGCECLVDIRSSTWQMVSSSLKCLDDPENLVITTIPIDHPQTLFLPQLSVVLPRYNLSFFVNSDGDLESCDFKDMVFDQNQCVGTLFGLQNRLVLRPNIHAEGLFHRCVIIPDGRVSRRERNHHVHISIDITSANARMLPVTYHTYHVDTDLGCLTGYVSWRSKLYLAHLHAQTSVDWWPDPLTGRTGIQESLSLLRSAACRSVMELDFRQEKPEFLFSPYYKLYPQIHFAMGEINYLVERGRFLSNHQSSAADFPQRPQPDMVGALRTAYLFPSEVIGPLPTPVDVVHPKSINNQDDFAYTILLAVYLWFGQSQVRVRPADIFKPPVAQVPSPAEVGAPAVESEESPFEYFGPSTELDLTSLLLPKEVKTPPLEFFDLPFLASPVHSISQDVKGYPEEQMDWGSSLVQKYSNIFRGASGEDQWFRLLFSLPAMLSRARDPWQHFLAMLVALERHISLNSSLHRDAKEHRGLNECQGSGPLIAALQDFFADARTPYAIGVLPESVEVHLYDLKKLNTEFEVIFTQRYRCNPEDHIAHDNLSDQGATMCIPSNPDSQRALPEQASYCLPAQFALVQLFHDRPAPKLPVPHQSRVSGLGPQINRTSLNSDSLALDTLFKSLPVNNTSTYQQQYVARLLHSAQHARKCMPMACQARQETTVEELQKHLVQCIDNYATALTILKKELGPKNDPFELALVWAGQWPHITPSTLFRCLASTSPIQIPAEWKQCLLSLAVLLVDLQRSRRLLRFSQGRLEEDFFRELENEGCEEWIVEEYSDWLLIQLQGNFLIRGIQGDVAVKMISPPTGQNTTMQVNMGEGKSSVILPITAATLADGNQLVRVIVPKALTVQMFRMLVDRLGGLVDRTIYHLPFTRSLTSRYSHQQFESMRELMSECMRNHGILVIQPEHVLSLKLISVLRQLPMHPSIHDATSLELYRSMRRLDNWACDRAFVELYTWVQSHSRDILDESDVVLHPRFQLIYTLGPKQNMEGYPDRWTITQEVLRLMKKHALSLSHDFPDSVEYEVGPCGSFPRIRIFRAADSRQHLISLILDDVMDGRLPNFSLRDIDGNQQLRNAVRAFISSKDVFKPIAEMVEKYARQSTLWDWLLLLRGLFAYNVLIFALAERRWRVDYGLSPKRTMLAVPYRAKDVPSPTAEFGHPDITIILTCLSYYYGGLTEEQLRTSFQILQEQEDPSSEYARWLQDYFPDSVPECIQDIGNVNTRSSEQWDKYLFPHFSRNQGAVDFYLSRVVFPSEAKEFPQKLATSSWDLVETRGRPVTGCSGTNDGQYLFPTSISQRNLDHQRGANARALANLLQPENSSYTLISHPDGQRRTTHDLLRMMVNQEPQIRVFLDVGAQILDLSNCQLAEAWLNLSSNSDGAIYFNEDDELMVLTKDGTQRTLVSSPLAQRLDRCVIYLDEAHTRGTDLKLPTGFRAAVTLGPKVTKDRLVQGCMRMRKLGNGHSVMFFVPLEVDQSIRVIACKEKQSIPVTTTDILRWTIHETWADTKHWAPYWAQQGINHKSRYDAWSDFCRNKLTREQLAVAWLQPELKSLADHYARFQPQNTLSYSTLLNDHLEIQQHCINLGVLQLPEAQLEEEQEREISREIEREREGEQNPQNAKRLEHCIHRDLKIFVKSGYVSPSSSAFVPAFTTLWQTFAARSKAHAYSPFILATVDFCRTVEPTSSQGRMDLYLRPVQWILSGKMGRDRVLVLLSPYEVDRLMPDIRDSKFIHLHVYTPCTSERMKPINDLRFYSIPQLPGGWTPPWDLIDQLNLFAGELYLRDYGSYLRLRRFLGIETTGPPNSVRTAVRRNSVTPDVLQEIGNAIGDSPLLSVMMLLAIRRRGLPFAETHMGSILQGHLLTEKDFKIADVQIPDPVYHNTQMVFDYKQPATTGTGDDSDSLGSSMHSRPEKREREIYSSHGDSGRPHKRLLIDQQR